MQNNVIYLIDKIKKEKSLSQDEYQILIESYHPEIAAYAAKEAVKVRQEIYGNKIYIRGLIEISNICRNDCLYCGIRKSNLNCERYRLSKQEILECCDEGYKLGFRTFVMQGGEDGYFTDRVLCDIVASIREKYPECAITLSLGERTGESYQKLYDAGANRYLLRHETACKDHYETLHPKEMSYDKRMQCLTELKKIGYQVGCGFMVGSPNQTTKSLAMDLKFVEEFQPDMCGIGPFIPHKDTVFCNARAGSVEISCYLLSLIRLIHPYILLPSTTALGTLDSMGREKGILAGANVVMPNLSPLSVRKKYQLYNNKINTGLESAQGLEELRKRMQDISYDIVCERGDVVK